MSSRPQRQKKRAYEKPRLRVIELAAEEVLAIGCKTNSESASGSTPCWLNGCSQLGS